MSDKPQTPCPRCGSPIHRTPDGYACDSYTCIWEIYEESFEQKQAKFKKQEKDR